MQSYFEVLGVRISTNLGKEDRIHPIIVNFFTFLTPRACSLALTCSLLGLYPLFSGNWQWISRRLILCLQHPGDEYLVTENHTSLVCLFYVFTTGQWALMGSSVTVSQNKALHKIDIFSVVKCIQESHITEQLIWSFLRKAEQQKTE